MTKHKGKTLREALEGEDETRARLFAVESLEAARRLFETTHNPIHVWSAIVQARRPGFVRSRLDPNERVPMPRQLIPEWVLTYLEDLAARIVRVRRLPRRERHAAIADEVGLTLRPPQKGGSPKSDQFDKDHDDRRMLIACRVAEHLRSGLTYTAAKAAVVSELNRARVEARKTARELGDQIGRLKARMRTQTPDQQLRSRADLLSLVEEEREASRAAAAATSASEVDRACKRYRFIVSDPRGSLV